MILAASPSLILLDERIGTIPGHEACKLIKAHPIGKTIPILLISAVHNLKRIATDCAADGYIAKPFDVEYVIQTVANFVT